MLDIGCETTTEALGVSAPELVMAVVAAALVVVVLLVVLLVVAKAGAAGDGDRVDGLG